jgi:zinc protease
MKRQISLRFPGWLVLVLFPLFSNIPIIIIAQHVGHVRLNDTIPLDPKVRYGKLNNGFTYYIRSNGEPQGKIEMHLAVRAGYDQEDNDQLELAHLLEHMPFNGTTHFQNPYGHFEGRGLKRGADINASTGGDRTTYYLIVPSDNPALIKEVLQFLRDCAHGITLNPDRIDKERGAVLGELRRASGYSSDMEKQYLVKLRGDSKYAFRIENTKANLQNFKHESLFRFYNDWYRPNLQAVVVVGDVDSDSIEEQIKILFSDLKNPLYCRAIKKDSSSFSLDNKFVAVTHEEMTDIAMEIYMKHAYSMPIDRGGIKRNAIKELYNTMIASRIAGLQDSEGSFQTMESRFIDQAPTPSVTSLFTDIVVKKGKIQEGFKAGLVELERIKRYGFSETELVKAKEIVLKSAFVTDNTSTRIANDLIGHFIEGSIAPGPEYIRELVAQLMKEIGIHEVNETIKNLITYDETDIVILAPKSEIGLLPDEVTLLTWINDVRGNLINHHEDKTVIKSPMTADQVSMLSAKIKFSRSSIDAIGVTELTLANGVRVLLKPFPVNYTRDSNRIYLHGISPGGTSLYSDGDYFSASFASSIVSQSGLGAFDAQELRNYMNRTGVRVSPFIVDRAEGIKASSKTEDIEVALQFVHQYFTQPKKELDAFKNILAAQKLEMTSQAVKPSRMFRDSISSYIYKGDIRKLPLRYKDLDKINLDRAFDIYQERFADAGDFTFVVSGNFDLEPVIPFLVKYLGSLPDHGRREVARNLKTSHANHKSNRRFYLGLEKDKADVRLRFSGAYTFSAKNNVTLDAIEFVLQDIMTKRLREKEGGTYAVSVVVKYSKINKGMYDFSIAFMCAPDNVENMIAYALEEIENLKYKNLTPEILSKIKTHGKGRLKESLDEVTFWTNYLANQIQNDDDLAEIIRQDKILDRLTAEEIKIGIKRLLTIDNLMQFVLLPKREEVRSDFN